MRKIIMALGLMLAATPTRADEMPIAFTIARAGEAIGHHRVTFTHDANGDLIASIEIAIDVRIAFVTVFRYRHQARETWRAGRLVAMEARTDDDGRRSVVRARATAAGLEIEGPHGRVMAPADILPTSYWRRDTIERRQLLDTQAGRVVNVEIRPAGDGLWRVSGDLQFTIGYTPGGAWSAMRFIARGAEVIYAPGARLASN